MKNLSFLIFLLFSIAYAYVQHSKGIGVYSRHQNHQKMNFDFRCSQPNLKLCLLSDVKIFLFLIFLLFSIACTSVQHSNGLGVYSRHQNHQKMNFDFQCSQPNLKLCLWLIVVGCEKFFISDFLTFFDCLCLRATFYGYRSVFQASKPPKNEFRFSMFPTQPQTLSLIDGGRMWKICYFWFSYFFRLLMPPCNILRV